VRKNPFHDGIADRWIPDQVMPVIDSELTGQDCGAAFIPVIQDLEEVPALHVAQGGETPVVNGEDVNSGKL